MTLAVFFPSLMGFGILVSGALLIGDQLHRVWPRSTSRRDHRVVSGAYEVVATIAATAGHRVPRPSFLARTFRSRMAYGAIAVIAAAGALLGWVAPMSAYNDPRGVFAGSPWMLGIAIGLAIGLGLVSLLCGVLATFSAAVPGWLRWLVRETSLGRIQVPLEFSRRAGLLTKGDDS